MPSSQKPTSRTAQHTRTPAQSSRPSARERLEVAHDRSGTRLTIALPRLSGRELEDATKSLAVFAEMLEIRRAERLALRLFSGSREGADRVVGPHAESAKLKGKGNRERG